MREILKYPSSVTSIDILTAYMPDPTNWRQNGPSVVRFWALAKNDNTDKIMAQIKQMIVFMLVFYFRYFKLFPKNGLIYIKISNYPKDSFT